jgi:hypothetical protein
MKIVKLSAVALMAISSLYAGGDIQPVEPAVETPTTSATSIDGKAMFYYYTFEGEDLFKKESTSAASAVTLDVSHKLFDGLSANFKALGYTTLGDLDMADDRTLTYGNSNGAFLNVANLTANFADTTLIAGRQELATPMLGSFDWLLMPSGFEAYTIANKSIDGLTLVGSYVTKLRGVGSDTFTTLDGENYAVGAAYSDAFDANVWYYNVDAADYTQLYADAGLEVTQGTTVTAQVVSTDFDDAGDDSLGYGAKVSTTVAGVELAAAYNHMKDRAAGMVEVDSMYTSMWNSFASQDVGDSYKVSAAGSLAGVDASIEYADFETIGEELDVILGYNVTDNFALSGIFTNTKYSEDEDAQKALEVIATYTF